MATTSPTLLQHVFVLWWFDLPLIRDFPGLTFRWTVMWPERGSRGILGSQLEPRRMIAHVPWGGTQGNSLKREPGACVGPVCEVDPRGSPEKPIPLWTGGPMELSAGPACDCTLTDGKPAEPAAWPILITGVRSGYERRCLSKRVFYCLDIFLSFTCICGDWQGPKSM